MSLVTAILLVLALAFISHFQGTSYAEIIQSHLITQQSLGAALLSTALLLFVVVGAMTWAISLEASFKVAGPLYRFSRNLKLAPIPNRSESIRQNDCLHYLSDKLVTSVDGLHRHYQQLTDLMVQGNGQLNTENEEVSKEFTRTIYQLKGLANHVCLN